MNVMEKQTKIKQTSAIKKVTARNYDKFIVENNKLVNTITGEIVDDMSVIISYHELTGELFMSYAATETYATLAALVGNTTNVVLKPTSAAASATNPQFTLTGTYLEALPVIDATLGELSSISLTFRGGVYTVSAP